MIILNQTFIILLILIFYVLLSIKQMELLNLVEQPSEVKENTTGISYTQPFYIGEETTLKLHHYDFKKS